MNLKNLYQYLVVDNQYKWNGWHNEYKIIFDAIDQIRTQLNSENQIKYDCDEIKALKDIGSKTEVKDFNTLLQVLFYNVDNGISSRGQSVLSKEKLEVLQKNTDFKDLIYQAIKSPNNNVCEQIKQEWNLLVEKNNPLLVHRFIAACTNAVSSMVNEEQFDKVYQWLINEKIIEKIEGDTWFNKNECLMNLFENELSNNYTSSQYDVFWRNMFPWIIFDNMANKFHMKKNIVKYGPPGTGKTFQAKAISNIQFNIWKDFYAENSTAFLFENHVETVQFHQSYTYEDFIEGLRPKLDTSGKAQLSLQNGIFKDFCKKAGRWELKLHQIDPDRQMTGSTKTKSWEDTTIQNLEDFLSSKQEVLNDLKQDNDWKYIFNYPNKKAKILDLIPPYFFIVDEINRADLSRVFGELMYCLEYRGIDGSIKTQYSKLNTKETALLTIENTNPQENEYRFFIPNNVYIIGTMNTIDRSVESFDFALRRRFSWEEVLPNTDLLKDHLKNKYKDWVDLADRFDELNKAISNEKQLLGPDYQIGHAYFWDLPDNTIRKLTVNQIATQLWQDRIMPLLQEYLRGTGREKDILDRFEKIMIK